MQPVNTKSLLAFIFTQMERLNDGEIDAQTACAQAKLASQASNVLNYELKRTIVQMRMQQIGAGIQAQDITLREIESKPINETNFPTKSSIVQSCQ
jgi:hypothetical protein